MFWLDNLNELTMPVLIPTSNMKFEEKLNAIIRIIILITLLSVFLLDDSKYVILLLIFMIISIIVYYYYIDKKISTEEYFNKQNIAIINNEKCIKPSQDNPFMNPNVIVNNNIENIPSCSIENEKIKRDMVDIFYSNIFRDSNDIYDKNLLERTFYTVPSTKIPNDSDKLAEWLYNRGPSCKENNGEKCYTNLYNNLKISGHF